MHNHSTTDAHRFGQIYCEISAVYHDISLRMGLSDSASMILYTLAIHDGSCLISQLVRETGLSKQTVNSALRKMEAEGLLYLEAEGRSKRIRVTESGQAVLRSTADRLIAAENRIYAAWSAEDRARYLELNQRFLDAMKEAAKEF